MIKKFLAAAALSLLTPLSAHAACSIDNTVPLKSLTAGFEAWKAVTDAMAECGNVEAELDQEFREKQPAAFAANPSLYHIGGVANATLVPLLNEGTIRPLDDLVAKHGQHLSPRQLIKIDGKVMAVAMMVNAQHLMYRKDVFDELGIEPPATYDQVLSTAAVIADAGVVDYPLGGTYQTGWNLAQEFINMFFGVGGEFFSADNMPTLNNEAGVKTLDMMKALSAYMDPEFLVADSTYVQQQFQQGKIAMANLWSSRAAAMDDADESQVAGKVGMEAAPRVVEGGKPATTLWWDGIVIAKNITDEEAEAAFIVAMEGLDEDMVKANNDAAVWLIDGFEPSQLAEGAIASAIGGATSYPASTEMGLMHTALGDNLSDFLTGDESAEQTLTDVEEAYLTAAKEKGLIK